MSRNTLLLAATILLSCYSAFAQLRIVGSISGSVHDPSGAIIPGARIELKDEGTGIAKEATATAEGTFTFPDLSHGMYAVTVTAPGFQQAVVNHIQVIASQTTDVPIGMKAGVRTTPWAVVRRPVRAAPSAAFSSKKFAELMVRLSRTLAPVSR